MPDDDWALGQNMVDVRNEARMARHGRTLKVDLPTFLGPDPELALVTAPLYDKCDGDCEAICLCDQRTEDE